MSNQVANSKSIKGTAFKTLRAARVSEDEKFFDRIYDF